MKAFEGEHVMGKPQRIELPPDLTKPFEVPAEATQGDIDAMITQLRKDADKMLGDKEPNVDGANWLLDAADSLRTRKGELVQAEAEHQARVDEARARLGGPNDETDEENDDAENDDDESDDEAETPPAGGAGDLNDPANSPPGEALLVASAARVAQRSALADAIKGQKGKAPAFIADLQRKSKPREAYLTAAAGAREFQVGQRVDMDAVGAIADDRFARLPKGPKGAGVTLPIAQVKHDTDPGLVASGQPVKGDTVSIDEAIAWAISEKRLQRETGESSLVAAGGWCAPSETLYDLLNISVADGLIDIPGIIVNRGGVRYTLGPDFTTVWNAGQNFTKTETQAIAGSAKPVVNIPCPSFTDHRMVVDGLYLTGDILSQKGYPEAYADYTAKSLVAFEHYVNMQTIADMVSAATATDMTQAGSGPTYYEAKSASMELLGAIELQAIDMRYKNRAAYGNLELVLPEWARGVIRSDLMHRAALQNPASISNADIDGFFATRGVNVQWVLDWQDAFSGVSGGFGAATAPKAWPTSVLFLLYPQGAYVRALSDVIELSAVYDSVLLQTNQFVALFMEQARLTLKRTFDTRVVTVPIKITGATGAAIDYTALQPTV